MSIEENLRGLRERIARAAERAGRDPAGVRLIGATAAYKGVTAEMVRSALDAGLRDFGENRLQEAEAQIAGLGERAREVTWHFIGHLQTNKAAAAVKIFDWIQTVDSVRLAEQLSRRSVLPKRILLEVNVAEEASKFGFRSSEVSGAVASIAGLPNLNLAGLMTVAPIVDNPEQLRPVFRQLRELAQTNGLTELSMGMTNDFDVAVEEGATMVRLGRAIFGEWQ